MTEIHKKSLQFLHKLRIAYSTEDNGVAFDALMYYLLTTTTTTTADGRPNLETRVKDAMAVCASPEGEEFYHKVRRVLSVKKNKDDDDEDGNASVYDFTQERAKAARRRVVESSSPEQFTSRVLSTFNERISCDTE